LACASNLVLVLGGLGAGPDLIHRRRRASIELAELVIAVILAQLRLAALDDGADVGVAPGLLGEHDDRFGRRGRLCGAQRARDAPVGIVVQDAFQLQALRQRVVGVGHGGVRGGHSDVGHCRAGRGTRRHNFQKFSFPFRAFQRGDKIRSCPSDTTSLTCPGRWHRTGRIWRTRPRTVAPAATRTARPTLVCAFAGQRSAHAASRLSPLCWLAASSVLGRR
jgi:hypothetical protein